MNICIHTEQVRDVGQQLRVTSDQLGELTRYLRGAINSLDTWAWDGRSRADAESLLDQIHPQGDQLRAELEHLGQMLQLVADRFEDEDSTAAGALDGLPWVDWTAAKPGMVLGAMAGMYVSAPPEAGGQAWEAMSWWERFQYRDLLKAQIADLILRQKDLLAAIKRGEVRIEEIDVELADLQAQRDALQAEADQFWNKIQRDPDGWAWGFDDGPLDAPWRTKADALQDEIAVLDAQITGLQIERNGLIAEQQAAHNELADIEQVLPELENDLAEAKARFKAELPFDGTNPAPGMDSIRGKPGQLPLKDVPVTSQPGERHPDLYEATMEQFAVGNNPRYTRDANTYCNTFAGDVARANGVPLPTKHEFRGGGNDSATIGFPELHRYFTDSNARVKAADQGWRSIGSGDLGALQSHVNNGKMAIVVNDGHIAVVRPGQTIADFDSIRIAQAGATNGNDMTLAQGFGNSSTPQIFIID